MEKNGDGDGNSGGLMLVGPYVSFVFQFESCSARPRTFVFPCGFGSKRVDLNFTCFIFFISSRLLYLGSGSPIYGQLWKNQSV